MEIKQTFWIFLLPLICVNKIYFFDFWIQLNVSRMRKNLIWYENEFFLSSNLPQKKKQSKLTFAKCGRSWNGKLWWQRCWESPHDYLTYFNIQAACEFICWRRRNMKLWWWNLKKFSQFERSRLRQLYEIKFFRSLAINYSFVREWVGYSKAILRLNVWHK